MYFIICSVIVNGQPTVYQAGALAVSTIEKVLSLREKTDHEHTHQHNCQ